MPFNNLAISWFDDAASAGCTDSVIKAAIDKAKVAGYDGVTFNASFHVDSNSGHILPGTSYERMFQWIDYSKSIGLDAHVKSYIVADDTNYNFNLDIKVGQNFSANTMLTEVATAEKNLAAVCQQHGVTTFYVGTENFGYDTAQYRAQWENIISKVRSVFTGDVTYDALYMNYTPGQFEGYHHIGFYDLLDQIGLSFYPSLSSSSTPIHDQGAIADKFFYRPDQAIYSLVNELTTLSETYHKPIVFGELAINNTTRATSFGLNFGSDQAPTDFTESTLVWSALYDVLHNNLNGVVTGVELYGFEPWLKATWLQQNIAGTDPQWQWFRDFERTYSNPLNDDIIAALRPYLQDDSYHETMVTNGSPYSDLIRVAYGDNVVNSGAGNDTLCNGSGADLINAGSGNDTFNLTPTGTYTSGFSAYNAGDPGHQGSGQTVSIVGKNTFATKINGDEGYDTVNLTSGDDAFFLHDAYTRINSGVPTQTDAYGMKVGARAETVEQINGGGGNDVIDLTSDVFSFSNVVLDGGAGNDVLWASSGNDTLRGGSGRDTLWGGSGSDLFVLETSAGSTDIIQDFVHGTDHINLAGGSYSHVTYNQGTGALYYDSVEIALVGTSTHPALVQSDFIF